MTSKDFVYFLQGFFEMSGAETLTAKQVEVLKNHLKLVFLYDIDPSYTSDKTVQAIFQNIHDGKEPLEGISITTEPVSLKPKPSSSGSIMKC